MKLFFSLAALLFSQLLFAQQENITLFYEVDEHQLNLDQQAKLRDFLNSHSKLILEKVVVKGHADSTASKAHNLTLSQRRAERVQLYLQSAGIAAGLIEMNFYGETLMERQSDLALSRKVEVYFIFKGDESRISELYDSLAQKQVYFINPHSDTVFVGTSGTVVTIKKGSFNVPDYVDSIQFELREIRRPSELVMENLGTSNNGEILEMANMIYINAMLGDDTLSLQKGINIMIPSLYQSNYLELLEGKWDFKMENLTWSANNGSVLRNFKIELLHICSEPHRLECIHCPVEFDHSYYYYQECLRKTSGGIAKCPCFFCRIKNGIEDTYWSIAYFFKQGLEDRYQFQKAKRKERKRLRYFRKTKDTLSVDEMNEWIGILDEGITTKDSNTWTPEEKGIISMREKIEMTDNLIKRGKVSKKYGVRCYELDYLKRRYGDVTYDSLLRIINKPMLDEFAVNTMDELYDTLQKSNMASVENAYQNREVSFQDFKYYVFQPIRLGWYGTGTFVNLPDERKVNLRVSLAPSLQNDCKLVFKNRHCVVPAMIGDGYFYFADIPVGEEAWLVGVKYENGQPFLAMKLVVTGEKEVSLDFMEKTLEELREELKVLDFD